MKITPFAIAVCLFAMFLFLPESEARLTPIDISEMKVEEPSPGNFFDKLEGCRDKLRSNYGTEFAFLINYMQQSITRGDNDVGRSRAASYFNLEIKQTLWPGSALYVEVESDQGKGIDRFIPTYSVFNTNAGDDVGIYIPEFYLEQDLMEDKISFAFGKLDLSDWFDGNTAAESGDTQFSSSALVNSLTIPFPSKGLGGLVYYSPSSWFYFQSGAATARASSTRIGLSDGFNSILFLNELGISPNIGCLKGNYRFIFYRNHEKIERIDGEGEESHDSGYGISFDQEVLEGITLFLRYGRADEKVRDIKHFWSFGGEIFEPIRGRKEDCLAVGVARSIMGKDYREANGDEASRSETMYEVYYRYTINDFMDITPNLQVVTHPNAANGVKTAVACGVRFLLSF